MAKRILTSVGFFAVATMISLANTTPGHAKKFKVCGPNHACFPANKKHNMICAPREFNSRQKCEEWSRKKHWHNVG